MLKPRHGDDALSDEIPERKLWHNEKANTPSLGCWGCPEYRICGGISVAAGVTSCLDLCCGRPGDCDKPCRNNPDYAFRVREVGGFSLDSVPRVAALAAPRLPTVIPVLFHRGRRSATVPCSTVALPLFAMFSRRDGKLRFRSHDEICAHFKLALGTQIILTGTDEDPPLAGC